MIVNKVKNNCYSIQFMYFKIHQQYQFEERNVKIKYVTYEECSMETIRRLCANKSQLLFIHKCVWVGVWVCQCIFYS